MILFQSIILLVASVIVAANASYGSQSDQYFFLDIKGSDGYKNSAYGTAAYNTNVRHPQRSYNSGYGKGYGDSYGHGSAYTNQDVNMYYQSHGGYGGYGNDYGKGGYERASYGPSK